MKQAGKRRVLLAVAALLLVLVVAGVLRYQNRPTKILVATDIHYLSPSLNDHGACFEKTILNGDGKALAYIDELTDAFVEQVIREKPAALILSGDLTLNGKSRAIWIWHKSCGASPTAAFRYWCCRATMT